MVKVEVVVSLNGRRAIKAELPEFLIRALLHRVEEANIGASDEEVVCLDDVVEWCVASPICVGDIPEWRKPSLDSLTRLTLGFRRSPTNRDSSCR
jgi:hypothetical protein